MCAVGRLSVYAPTLERAPSSIYALRREILRMQPARVIVRQGERIRTVYTLYEGWAFRFRELSSGRRHILSFFVPGDMILLEGLVLSGSESPCSVKSLTAVVACGFPIDDLCRLMEDDPAQRQQVTAYLQRSIAATYRRSADLARRNTLGRIAQLLLEISDRLRKRDLVQNESFEFPLTQEHIADAIGATQEHVNRMLDRLRSDKIISLERKCMTLLDIERLRQMADEL